MADVEKFHFRLVLLGSNGAGKTSILNRFLFKKFETKYKPTVEDLFSKDFDLGSLVIKVDFLDTSGSMQFPAMRRLSITTGSAFLIVYSVDDENSYEILKICIAEIQEIRPDYQEIPIIFAGNKCDIPKEKRKVLKELVSNYVHYELPRLRAKVIECSCRDGINIDSIFKSYLSLARVSLSTAVSASLKQRAPASASASPVQKVANATLSIQQHTSASRSSSMKNVLGVRRSCDASILSLRKNTYSSELSSQTRTNDTIKELSPSSETANNEQIDLSTAIKNSLDLNQQAKPRSRSLIWHSTRKARASQVDNADCIVS